MSTLLSRRRQMMMQQGGGGTVVEESVTWSGSGSDKTASPIIDASSSDIYFVLPFISGDSRLASGVTEDSNYAGVQTYLYSDEDATELVGYYFFDTDTISTTSRTWINCPNAKFGQRFKIAPRGYYAQLRISRRSGVFTSNSAVTQYLNAYGNKVEHVS